MWLHLICKSQWICESSQFLPTNFPCMPWRSFTSWLPPGDFSILSHFHNVHVALLSSVSSLKSLPSFCQDFSELNLPSWVSYSCFKSEGLCSTQKGYYPGLGFFSVDGEEANIHMLKVVLGVCIQETTI